MLSLAIEGLYRPLWSDAILAELEYDEAAKLDRRGTDRDVAQGRASSLIRAMHACFDDACVSGWEPLEGTFGLPDADDEHVAAAAVVGGAGAIVTDNLRHLRVPSVPAGIHVLTPSEFASDTVAVDPTRALQAITAMTQRLRPARRCTWRKYSGCSPPATAGPKPSTCSAKPETDRRRR